MLEIIYNEWNKYDCIYKITYSVHPIQNWHQSKQNQDRMLLFVVVGRHEMLMMDKMAGHLHEYEILS